MISWKHLSWVVGLLAGLLVLRECSHESDRFESKVAECTEKGAAYLVVYGLSSNGSAPNVDEARKQADMSCRTKGTEIFDRYKR